MLVCQFDLLPMLLKGSAHKKSSPSIRYDSLMMLLSKECQEKVFTIDSIRFNTLADVQSRLAKRCFCWFNAWCCLQSRPILTVLDGVIRIDAADDSAVFLFFVFVPSDSFFLCVVVGVILLLFCCLFFFAFFYADSSPVAVFLSKDVASCMDMFIESTLSIFLWWYTSFDM